MNDHVMDLEREGKPIHTMFKDAKRRESFSVCGTMRYLKFVEYCKEQGYEVVDVRSPHYNGNVFTGRLEKIQ